METEHPLTKKCQNCQKPFPTDRVDLHEAYCKRNIRKCRQCDAMIDIKQQEQHDREYHEKTPCPLCKLMILPNDDEHEDLCPQKLKFCEYCELEWPQAIFLKHQETCASRTKACPICKKVISFRQFDDHEKKCEKKREPRNEISQEPIRNRRNQRGERERQSSSNNLREIQAQTNPVVKGVKSGNLKPSNIIGPQITKPICDPLPICVRLALKNKEQRGALKGKN